MSKLSDALGVPEGKPFEFRGGVYVVKGNVRSCKRRDGSFVRVLNEEDLTYMLDNVSEIKLLPPRYKRKEPEIVEACRVDGGYVPEWAWSTLRGASDGDYAVRDSTGSIKVCTPEEFESAFEEVE